MIAEICIGVGRVRVFYASVCVCTRAHSHLLTNTSAVKADPSEHHNVAKDHPELRTELLNELMAVNMSIFDPFRGHPTYNACTAAIDHGGFYGPFSHVPENWYTERKRTTEQILADTLLKAKLKPFDNPEVRQSMADAAQKYGESELAVRSMHTVDACLDPEGEKLKTLYCAPGPLGQEKICDEMETTLEYPEHVVRKA